MLKNKWNSAPCFASRLEPIEERRAVTVVPILHPKRIGSEARREIVPVEKICWRTPMEALDD